MRQPVLNPWVLDLVVALLIIIASLQSALGDDQGPKSPSSQSIVPSSSPGVPVPTAFYNPECFSYFGGPVLKCGLELCVGGYPQCTGGFLVTGTVYLTATGSLSVSPSSCTVSALSNGCDFNLTFAPIGEGSLTANFPGNSEFFPSSTTFSFSWTTNLTTGWIDPTADSTVLYPGGPDCYIPSSEPIGADRATCYTEVVDLFPGGRVPGGPVSWSVSGSGTLDGSTCSGLDFYWQCTVNVTGEGLLVVTADYQGVAGYLPSAGVSYFEITQQCTPPIVSYSYSGNATVLVGTGASPSGSAVNGSLGLTYDAPAGASPTCWSAFESAMESDYGISYATGATAGGATLISADFGSILSAASTALNATLGESLGAESVRMPFSGSTSGCTGFGVTWEDNPAVIPGAAEVLSSAVQALWTLIKNPVAVATSGVQMAEYLAKWITPITDMMLIQLPCTQGGGSSKQVISLTQIIGTMEAGERLQPISRDALELFDQIVDTGLTSELVPLALFHALNVGLTVLDIVLTLTAPSSLETKILDWTVTILDPNSTTVEPALDSTDGLTLLGFNNTSAEVVMSSPGAGFEIQSEDGYQLFLNGSYLATSPRFVLNHVGEPNISVPYVSSIGTGLNTTDSVSSSVLTGNQALSAQLEPVPNSSPAMVTWSPLLSVSAVASPSGSNEYVVTGNVTQSGMGTTATVLISNGTAPPETVTSENGTFTARVDVGPGVEIIRIQATAPGILGATYCIGVGAPMGTQSSSPGEWFGFPPIYVVIGAGVLLICVVVAILALRGRR